MAAHDTPFDSQLCIAVCTRNRAIRLQQALDSLVRCSVPEDLTVELLVVDNNSTDQTQSVCEAFAATNHDVRFRYVKESQVGFAFVRNRALVATHAEWLAFFDDDQVADPDWLSQLWRSAKRHNSDCVGGCVQLELPQSGFAPGPRCRGLLGESACDQERQYGGEFQPGMGNLLIRRRRLVDLGGFDTHKPGRGEDTRLFSKLQQMGCDCWYAPNAVVKHVISPERNQPDAYRQLAKACADGADLSYQAWGWRLPMIASLRFCRLCAVVLPRAAFASVFGSAPSRLDAQCAVIMEFWRGVYELQYSLGIRR